MAERSDRDLAAFRRFHNPAVSGVPDECMVIAPI